MKKRNNIVKDYVYENESKNIYKYTNKYNDDVIYKVQITFKGKMYSKCFKCLKQAKKYVDLKCIEHKQKQVYNTFKKV